ncbi:DoxX family membrane protein [bacterium]|nr:DoxX family membrane protein [bacterium]
MDKLIAYIPLVARLLLSALFILGGIGKLSDVSGFAGYLAMGGLPAFLAWPAILFEISVGVSMILGYQTRIMALLAAGFCLVTAALYHSNFADQTMMIMFLKNLGLAGGFLMVFAHGPGTLALDKARA